MDAAIFGLIVADVIAEPMDLRHPPAPGGLTPLNSLSLATGGNACNVSIAMAKLGMKTAAAGMIGEDVLGRAMLERLHDVSVDTRCVFASKAAQTSRQRHGRRSSSPAASDVFFIRRASRR